MEYIMNKNPLVNIITVTLNRPSLIKACNSVDKQTYKNWHHYVIGDGILPNELINSKRSVFGFSRPYGKEEPGMNMPDGTPNPIQRWALKHLQLNDFFCFLDDDNIYDDHFIEKMVKKLKSEKSKGCVLCKVLDKRHLQDIQGKPEAGNCDNSGAMFRKKVADTIIFPFASMNKNVTQDVEFIQLVAKKFGWCNLPEKLVVFGDSPNLPTVRGGIKLLESWEVPINAFHKMKNGKLKEAITDLKKSIEIDPMDCWSIWRLAEAYAVNNKIKQSKQLLKDWISLVDKTNSINHHYIFFCYGFAKEVLGEDGSKIYEKALKSIKTYNYEQKLSKEWYSIFAKKTNTINKYASILKKIDPKSDKFENALWKAKIAKIFFPKNENINSIYNLLLKNETI